MKRKFGDGPLHSNNRYMFAMMSGFKKFGYDKKLYLVHVGIMRKPIKCYTMSCYLMDVFSVGYRECG